MKKTIAWLTLSCLLVAVLVSGSCKSTTPEKSTAPATATTQTATTTQTTPPTQTTPKIPATTTTSAPATTTAKEQPTYGGTVNLVWTIDPQTCDPYFSSGSPDTFMTLYMDTLGMGNWAADRSVCPFQYFYNPLSCCTGMLAESWETPDPQTYVFHIRHGVNFQNKPPANGRELTAYDCAYAYQRLFGLGTTPDTQKRSVIATGQADWQALKSVEVTDKWTVVVKLTSVQPRFLEFFVASAINDYIYPPEVVQRYGDLTDWRNANGSGAFMITDYVAASSMTFKKNPGYWLHDERYPTFQLPYVDTVKALIIPDLSTRLAAVRSGKVDVMGGLTVDQTTQLKQSNPKLNWESLYYGAWGVDPRWDLKPFNDIRVRKAMQMALDNKTIAATYYKGYADPFPSFLTAGVGYIYTPLDQYPKDVQDGFAYNPEGAKKLLADAGYPNGFKTNLAMSSADLTDLAEVVKSYFKAVGIDMEIKVYEPASYTAAIYASPRPFEMCATGGQGATVGFIDMISWRMKPASWNFGDVDDPELIKMVNAIKSEPNANKRADMEKAALVYVNSQFYMACTPTSYRNTCWQPWLKGFKAENQLGGQNYGFVWARVWVDRNLKLQIAGIKD